MIHSSDFGSDLSFGDFWFSSDTSSRAQAGTATLRSTIISFALNFFPYNFSLALPSERRVDPSNDIPANNPLFLILEGAQAGLSWETILNKREN